jgi:hypothetical protein
MQSETTIHYLHKTIPLTRLLHFTRSQPDCYNKNNFKPPARPRMQITIEVPDRLGEQLQQLGDRLPEALDRVLQELISTETTENRDEGQIVELLASQPSPEEVLAIRPSPARDYQFVNLVALGVNPEEVLAIRPSPALQARMSELLAQNKSGTLTRSEEVELDRYLLLEHWIRLAKVYAHESQNSAI